MSHAPNGAVNRMEKTATDKIISPPGIPREKGIEPIAACTVALGK